MTSSTTVPAHFVTLTAAAEALGVPRNRVYSAYCHAEELGLGAAFVKPEGRGPGGKIYVDLGKVRTFFRNPAATPVPEAAKALGLAPFHLRRLEKRRKALGIDHLFSYVEGRKRHAARVDLPRLRVFLAEYLDAQAEVERRKMKPLPDAAKALGITPRQLRYLRQKNRLPAAFAVVPCLPGTWQERIYVDMPVVRRYLESELSDAAGENTP